MLTNPWEYLKWQYFKLYATHSSPNEEYDSNGIFFILFQLKLYATRKSFSSPIDEEYDPKAESVETWEEWNSANRRKSEFLISFFILFPVISWFILIPVLFYINDSSPDSRMNKVAKALNDHNTSKKEELWYHLQNEFTLSLTCVVAAFIFSCLALSAAFQTEEQMNK